MSTEDNLKKDHPNVHAVFFDEGEKPVKPERKDYKTGFEFFKAMKLYVKRKEGNSEKRRGGKVEQSN